MKYEIIVYNEKSEKVHTGVFVQSLTPKHALELAYAWTDIEEVKEGQTERRGE